MRAYLFQGPDGYKQGKYKQHTMMGDSKQKSPKGKAGKLKVRHICQCIPIIGIVYMYM